MKTSISLIVSFLVLVASVRGQGTFVYDQQSADESGIQEGGADIQQNQLIGQSFTPQLASVGFLRLFIYNGLLGDTSTATIYVNLRMTSISGPVLGQSGSVVIAGGSLFAAPVDFLFGSNILVTAGTTYYFQPVVQNNNNLGVNSAATYSYSGGTAFSQGAPSANTDLWFREGIVVPEPSSVTLLLLGAGAFALRRLGTRKRVHEGKAR